MRKYLIIPLFFWFCSSVCAFAQVEMDEDEDKRPHNADLLEKVASMPEITIDTTFVKKYSSINNYSMIGVQYGVNLATASMNPSREFKMNILPIDVGVVFTRYCKMFGYMPYFGVQVGVFYTQQSYQFATSKESGYPVFNMLGAYKVTMPVIEAPASAQFHYDFWKMKIMANLGVHVGYRLGIDREYNDMQCKPDDPRRVEYAHKFHANENRFYLGLHGGGGLAIVLDPIEIHLTATYKYGLTYLHKPNISTRTFVENEDKSKYYYNWTNANNIVVSVGIHYQLTRRTGTTTRELKEEAKRRAYEQMQEAKAAVEKARRDAAEASRPEPDKLTGPETKTEPESKPETEDEADNSESR